MTNTIQAANNIGKGCPNNAYRIQRFTILPTSFPKETGELTPTKKLKHKIVETSVREKIEKLIHEAQGVIKERRTTKSPLRRNWA